MNKVVEELKKVKVFYIATIKDNEPRVRPFGSVMEFENNAYLCSGNFKEFYQQVKKIHMLNYAVCMTMEHRG